MTTKPFALASTVLSAMFPLVAQNGVATFQVDTDAQIEVPAAPVLVPRTGITVEAWVTYDDATMPTGAGD